MAQNRTNITEKMLQSTPEGNFVLSPLGVWATLLISSYSIPEAMALINADEDKRAELFDKLSRTVEFCSDHEEISISNFAWANDKNLLPTYPNDTTADTRSPMPSKKDADALIAELTKGIITEHPSDLTDPLIFTNVLSVFMEWTKPFKTYSNTELDYWMVKDILSDFGTQGENGEVKYVQDEDGHYFGVFSKKSIHNTIVSSVVSLDGEVRKESALRIANQISRGKANLIPLWRNDAQIPQTDNFRTKMMITESPSYSIQIPAWEMRTSLDLGQSFELPPDLALVQESYAKYQVKGFEAVAVTAMMARAAMIMEKQLYTWLDFDKPFASAVHTPEGPLKGMPLFIAWTEEGVEPEEE